jgi:hypothetical protein
MAFQMQVSSGQLSPGVSVSEVDLTTIVPSVSASAAAIAGNFVWGPANEIITVGNEVELVDRFGKPDTNTFETFFSAANFLAYSDTLRIVRTVGSGSYNATGNGQSILIRNKTDYENNYVTLPVATTANVMFAARYPGDLGNSLNVSACGNTTAFTGWSYKTQFDSAPNTSSFVSARSGSNDEIHIIVVDQDGKFSGVPGTVLEKFPYLSKASDAKTDDGSSNYYVNVINDRSKYVHVIAHANGGTNWGTTSANTAFAAAAYISGGKLSGGVTVAPSTANLQSGYDYFASPEAVDISLIITANNSQTVAKYVVDNIAEVRKDCVVFISPERPQVVNNPGSEVTSITTFRNLFNSSSFAVADCNWKYQFDKYNNVSRWVPLNGDIAGLCARTDADRDPWFSPAGLNRGTIKNAIKLAWNPTKTNRDDLYKIGINPVISIQGEGTVLFGDKTMLAKPSAFDRINVRRLFIVLEKAITIASRYSLFEFNDEFTRAQFVALIEPYLRDVKGRRGIYDFRVVCDTTNNTPEVIDRNEFVGDIYIKPARSINFIKLNFVAVRTGVAFEEVVGRF